MRKTLWIAMVCGLVAALLMGICAVNAQTEVFEHYQKRETVGSYTSSLLCAG